MFIDNSYHYCINLPTIVTLRELFSWAGQARLAILFGLAAAVLVTVFISFLNRKTNKTNSLWRYAYSVIVYVVCAPGILAAVTLFYSVIFIGENLIDINLLIYAYPIIIMTLVLTIIRKNIPFDNIPGFKRITGLLIMLTTTFAILFTLLRLRILLFFGSSLWSFFMIAIIVFLLLKWGGRLLFSDRRK